MSGPSRGRYWTAKPGQQLWWKLTPRLYQVLVGISYGLTNQQLAKELFTSEDTVKTHAYRLYRVLEAVDRTHAVRRGFELGLLQAGPMPRLLDLKVVPGLCNWHQAPIERCACGPAKALGGGRP